MKKNIIFFIQNGVGGAERMTVNIAKMLPEQEWDVMFCKVSMPCQVQSGRIDDLIPKGIKVTNIFWSGQLSFLHQLWKVLKSFQPDVVFSSVMPYNQRLLLLSPLFKNTRFIVRNDNYLFTVSPLKRFSIKLTYRLADKIVAQTEEMQAELEALGLDPSRIVTLHNMLDTATIDAKSAAPSPFPDDGRIRYVAVGRVAPQKGFDILVQAFRIVADKQSNSELYIVGDYLHPSNALEYEIICRLIDELHLNGRVTFTGYTDNPYRYIKNASAFVLSSRYEGLPNVLAEAQYLGTPSAATECIPIIGRMISNGKNGYLAHPEDSHSLANAMIAASHIKEVKQIYKSSTPADFLSLFS